MRGTSISVTCAIKYTWVCKKLFTNLKDPNIYSLVFKDDSTQKWFTDVQTQYVRNWPSHLLCYSPFPPASNRSMKGWLFIHSGQEHRNRPRLFPSIGPLSPKLLPIPIAWVDPASPCTTAEAPTVCSSAQYLCPFLVSTSSLHSSFHTWIWSCDASCHL